MADLDLQIKGGQSADPEIRGGGLVSKTVFSALWAPVWSKDYGGTAPHGPSPRSPTVIYKVGR